ncbi:MAG: DUF433 domain-containing protein [Nitrospiria bacterium]
MKHYISSTPAIMSGMPVVIGTRVPIARIIFLLKEGYTVPTIHGEFPHVPLQHIEGAVTELVKMLTDTEYAKKILQV